MATEPLGSTVLSNDSEYEVVSPEASIHFGKTTLLSAYETGASFLQNDNNTQSNEHLSLEVESLINSNEKVTSFFVNALTEKVEYQIESKTYVSSIPFNSIIGAKLTTLNFQPKDFQLFNYKTFLISPENSSSEFNISFFIYKQKKVEALTFKLQNIETIVQFLSNFNATLNKSRTSSKLLVVLNPNGGDRNSQYLFDTIALPILTLANLKVDVWKSERERHIFDLFEAKNNLQEYGAIVSCGGDGTLHEVANAALKHREWQTVVNIPFAVLPAGSGNGTATSLHLLDFQAASIALAFHNAQPYDIAVVHNDYDSSLSYLMLDITSGFIADVDETADSMRWLGKVRLEVASVLRALFLRHYSYTISYLKPDVEMHLDSIPTTQATDSHVVVDVEPSQPKFGPSPTLPNLIQTFQSTHGQGLGHKWSTLEMVKSNLFVLNTPFISHNCRVSETADPTNQSLTLAYEKTKLSPFGFLGKLIKESDNPGQGHYSGLLQEDYLKAILIRCNGRAKGNSGDSKNISTFRLDGEPMPKVTTIQLEVLPKAIQFIFPNPQS